jgi:predicted Co/Zn/Cd cation transporter (cation efflux family)
MEMKPQTILIYKTKTGWIARFEDPTILALFGTFDIPMPFTDKAEPERVLDEIRKRNPGCIVKLLENTNTQS